MNTTTIDSNWNLDHQMIALLGDSPESTLEAGRIIFGQHDTYTVLTSITVEAAQSKMYYGINKKGQEVAIKLYLENHGSKAFERERFAHRLISDNGGHSHIIPALEFLMEQHSPIAIFPFVEGKTIEEIMSEKKMYREEPMDQEEIVPIVSTLCDATDDIHSLNLVHRDIKPSNVMITKPAPRLVVPQLFDFGIAWHPDIADYDKAQHRYATPIYMAPEKWGFSAPDKREDIFSLAALFYELLSGEVPFKADNLAELFHLHTQKTPISDLTKITPFVCDEVNAVIQKGLAYDPSQRYETAGEMKQAYLKAVGRK